MRSFFSRGRPRDGGVGPGIEVGGGGGTGGTLPPPSLRRFSPRTAIEEKGTLDDLSGAPSEGGSLALRRCGI